MGIEDGIRLTCPRCHHRLRVKAAAAGKRVRCPNGACGAVLAIPLASHPDPRPPQSEAREFSWRQITDSAPPPDAEPPRLRPRTRPWLWVAGGAVAVPVVVGAALLWLARGGPAFHGLRDLPGAKGPRLQMLGKPNRSIPVKDIFLCNSPPDLFETKGREVQYFPSGTPVLHGVVAFEGAPAEGTRFDFTVFSASGPLNMSPRGHGTQELRQFGQVVACLVDTPLCPEAGVYPDGDYQAEVRINGERFALLNWSVGKAAGDAPAPRPGGPAAQPEPGMPAGQGVAAPPGLPAGPAGPEAGRGQLPPAAPPGLPASPTGPGMPPSTPGMLPGVPPGGRPPRAEGQEPPADGDDAAQAARTLVAALDEGNLGAAWDGLPAGYQKDLNDLVHDFAGRMDRQLWARGMRVLQSAGTVLATKGDDIAALLKASGGNVDAETVKNLPALGKWLLAVASSDMADLEKMKTTDLGVLLKQFSQASPRGRSGPGIKARVVEQRGGTARVKLEVPANGAAGPAAALVNQVAGSEGVELVKVEGKWVPRRVAEQWKAGMAVAHKSAASLAEELSGGSKEPILALLGAVEGTLQDLRKAEGKEQFQAALQSGAKVLAGKAAAVDFEALTSKLGPAPAAAAGQGPDAKPFKRGKTTVADLTGKWRGKGVALTLEADGWGTGDFNFGNLYTVARFQLVPDLQGVLLSFSVGTTPTNWTLTLSEDKRQLRMVERDQGTTILLDRVPPR
jgi:hypothetical protein